MPTPLHDLPPPWHQPSHHSTEVEHRFTLLEIEQRQHREKLSLHEKAILGLAGTLYIVAQDKFPLIASVIRGLLIP